MLCGGVLGALVMAVVVVFSAGHPSQADDGKKLADILAANGLQDDKIKSVLQQGMSTWAQWRWKSRPMLWRWGMDWPEWGQLLEKDLETYYSSLVPAPPPSVGQLAKPEPEQSEQSQDSLLDARAALTAQNAQPEPASLDQSESAQPV
jgi:hypothetical protein